MNDGDYEIDLIDKTGAITGRKLRRDVVKGVDAYHAVYCVVITPKDEIVLNLIAKREDMPNLHAGKYGCTCATIKRSGETAQESAERAVKNELKIEARPVLIREELLDVDGTHRLIGWYTVDHKAPTDYNKEDIAELVKVAKSDFSKILDENPDKITPPLKKFWEFYQ